MSFIPAKVNIGSVIINNTDHSSTISFGSALEVNRNVSGKKNQGFGQQHADACLRFCTVSMTMDDEPADSISAKMNR